VSLRRRAQVSLEFFALMGFLTLTFVALLMIVQQRGTSIIQETRVNAEQAVGDVILREVRYAGIAGPGYTRDSLQGFQLPQTLSGLNYTVEIHTGKEVAGNPNPNAAVLLIRYRDRPDIAAYIVALPYNVQDQTCALVKNCKPACGVGTTRPSICHDQIDRVLIFLPDYVRTTQSCPPC
jgi:hypothetical protein